MSEQERGVYIGMWSDFLKALLPTIQREIGPVFKSVMQGHIAGITGEICTDAGLYRWKDNPEIVITLKVGDVFPRIRGWVRFRNKCPLGIRHFVKLSLTKAQVFPVRVNQGSILVVLLVSV